MNTEIMPGRKAKASHLFSFHLNIFPLLLLLWILMFSVLPGVITFSALPGAAMFSVLPGVDPSHSDFPAKQKKQTGYCLPGAECRALWEQIDRPLSLCEVSPEERDLVIFLFESACPEKAKKLDRFLKGQIEIVQNRQTEDIQNIKYTVYTAPELWRDMFLQNIGQMRLQCSSGRDCYVSGLLFKKVCVDLSAAASDPRGPYTSFFHECGHGIGEILFSDECRHEGAEVLSPAKCGKGASEVLSSAECRQEGCEILPSAECRQEGCEILPSAECRQEGCEILSSAECRQEGCEILPSAECRQEGCELFFSSERAPGSCMENLTGLLELETKKGAAAGGHANGGSIGRTCTSVAASFLPPGEAVSDMRSAFLSAEKKSAGYIHEPSYWDSADMPAKEFFAEYFSYQICRNETALDSLENPEHGVYPLSTRLIRETVRNFDWEGRCLS